MQSGAGARNLSICLTSLRRSSSSSCASTIRLFMHSRLTRSLPLTAYRYELADSAASRALLYDPKHIKALYRRALARNALGRYNAAMHGQSLSSSLSCDDVWTEHLALQISTFCFRWSQLIVPRSTSSAPW